MELKTIAIRVPPELHQQLVLLASLAGRPLVEELREAIDAHIGRRSAEVDLTAQAKAALDEIDKETASRRKAIEALLGGSTSEIASTEAKRRKGAKRNA